MRDFDTAIDLIIRTLNAIPRFIKEGITPQTLMVALPLLLYIFKFQALKNRLGRYFPGLIKKNGEPVNPVYVGNQEEIKHNLARLLAERGMQWESANSSPVTIPFSAQKSVSRYTLRSAASTIARYVKRFTSSNMRRITMKSKFKSRKFILAVVTAALIVLNDGLDLGIDNETVLAFAGIVATWIIGESAVDAKRAGKGNDNAIITGDSGPAE